MQAKRESGSHTHLNSIDVAGILDVTPDEVCRLARKGVLKGIKVKSRWHFNTRAVIVLQKKRQLLQRLDSIGTDADPKLSMGYTQLRKES